MESLINYLNSTVYLTGSKFAGQFYNFFTLGLIIYFKVIYEEGINL